MRIEPAAFVRWVLPDENPDDSVNEAKYRTWEAESEHALLTLATGERPMVRGGRDGIRFDVEIGGEAETIVVDVEGHRERVVRIEWHTHPRVTGPSDGDREAIRILKQAASRIFEIGGDGDGTSFGPDKGKPHE